MSTWADEYLTLLDDCEERSEKLSDWECGFVDSMQRQPGRLIDCLKCEVCGHSVTLIGKSK